MYKPFRGVSSSIADIRYNPVSGVPAPWIQAVRRQSNTDRTKGKELDERHPMFKGNNILIPQTELPTPPHLTDVTILEYVEGVTELAPQLAMNYDKNVGKQQILKFENPIKLDYEVHNFFNLSTNAQDHIYLQYIVPQPTKNIKLDGIIRDILTAYKAAADIMDKNKHQDTYNALRVHCRAEIKELDVNTVQWLLQRINQPKKATDLMLKNIKNNYKKSKQTNNVGSKTKTKKPTQNTKTKYKYIPKKQHTTKVPKNNNNNNNNNSNTPPPSPREILNNNLDDIDIIMNEMIPNDALAQENIIYDDNTGNPVNGVSNPIPPSTGADVDSIDLAAPVPNDVNASNIDNIQNGEIDYETDIDINENDNRNQQAQQTNNEPTINQTDYNSDESVEPNESDDSELINNNNNNNNNASNITHVYVPGQPNPIPKNNHIQNTRQIVNKKIDVIQPQHTQVNIKTNQNVSGVTHKIKGNKTKKKVRIQSKEKTESEKIIERNNLLIKQQQQIIQQQQMIEKQQRIIENNKNKQVNDTQREYYNTPTPAQTTYNNPTSDEQLASQIADVMNSTQMPPKYQTEMNEQRNGMIKTPIATGVNPQLRNKNKYNQKFTSNESLGGNISTQQVQQIQQHLQPYGYQIQQQTQNIPGLGVPFGVNTQQTTGVIGSILNPTPTFTTRMKNIYLLLCFILTFIYFSKLKVYILYFIYILNVIEPHSVYNVYKISF